MRSAPASTAHSATSAASSTSNPPSAASVAEMRTMSGRALARGLPHRPHDAQQQPRAVLERAAVLVVAGVRQRREELVQQVAVGSVHLEHVEARVERAPRRRGEVIHDGVDARLVQRHRLGEALVREGGRRDGLPAALLRRRRCRGDRRTATTSMPCVRRARAGCRPSTRARGSPRRSAPRRRAARRSRCRCRGARCGPRARRRSPRRRRAPRRPTRTARGACGATPAARRRSRCTCTWARPRAGCGGSFRAGRGGRRGCSRRLRGRG